MPKLGIIQVLKVTEINDLRKDIDLLETIVPRDLWPVPVYADLLFKL